MLTKPNALDEFWEKLGDKEKLNVRSYRPRKRDIQDSKGTCRNNGQSTQTLANGGIDNMDEYKYIIGKIHAVEFNKSGTL